jgi:hypothetical protein
MLVFESNAQQNIAWDGKSNVSDRGNVASANNISSQSQNNTLLPEGIYFIVFEYSDGLHKNISVDVYLKR